MKNVKITPLKSNRSGRPIANQYKIETPKGKYFQSYKSIIAFVPKQNGKIKLDEYYHNYSRTTSKYLTQFLGLNTKERQSLISEGGIKLTNLNK